MEHLTIFGAALFCAVPILWLKGPRRSEMWRHLIEGLDWLRSRCEDAMLAAEFRESRRAARKPKPQPEKQDQAPYQPAVARIGGTDKLFDNGREIGVQRP